MVEIGDSKMLGLNIQLSPFFATIVADFGHYIAEIGERRL